MCWFGVDERVWLGLVPALGLISDTPSPEDYGREGKGGEKNYWTYKSRDYMHGFDESNPVVLCVIITK